MDKKHCIGCRNNFYNGNNDIGTDKCWMLKSARLRDKHAISSSTPTYQENFYPVRVPSCYNQPGILYVDDISIFPQRKGVGDE